MVGKYKVITLCGSTRFKDEFIRAQKDLTLQGNIVVSVGLFGHSGDNEVWSDQTKEMLDDMHKRKIDMADEIFVINVDGYIGDSTASEIAYAESCGKPVKYLVPDCNLCEHINIPEFFDNRDKLPHKCDVYNELLKHLANTKIHNPFIHPCDQCMLSGCASFKRVVGFHGKPPEIRRRSPIEKYD